MHLSASAYQPKDWGRLIFFEMAEKSLSERLRLVLEVEANQAQGTFMQRQSAIETATGFQYLGIDQTLLGIADEIDALLQALEPFAAFAGPCVDAETPALVDAVGWTDAGAGTGSEQIGDWFDPEDFYQALSAYLNSAGDKNAVQASLKEDNNDHG